MVQGCRGGAGGAKAVQGGAGEVQGDAGEVQATCTVCTSASIISGAGRYRHTSGCCKKYSQSQETHRIE